MNIKDVFGKSENGALTYEQFEEFAKGAKFADLSEGNYVSKGRYEDDLASRDKQIETLNGTITSRDSDLESLKTQLAEAGTDKTKLDELSSQFSSLQGKYDADIKQYQSQLSKQAYEFAVREFAGTKNFTSQAAKRDFVQSMIGKELKMEGDKILGAEDFVTAYSVDNSDAFVVSEPDTKPNEDKKTPHFVDATGKQPAPKNDNPFNFNFVGVRPREDK